MKLPRWFRGRSWREKPAGDTQMDRDPPGAHRQINGPISAVGAPEPARLSADAFALQFLQWTSRHAEHGPTDVRRLEALMAEFADDHGLMPLKPATLFGELDCLGIGSRERDVFDYEHRFGNKSADRGRLTTRFYVLPQRFPIRPAPRVPSKPSPSGQYDLFKRGGRGSRHGR
jgi:hypothetical protein